MSHDPAAEAAVFLSLISPPEFSTPPTPLMVEAYGVAMEEFIRAGGAPTLREWCLMPQVLRDEYEKARERVIAGLVPK